MNNETSSPNPAEAASPSPARRDRSVAARRAARLKKAGREQRIISLLNRGVSVAEIAAREGLSLSRMRRLVQAILATRLPQPPAEFLALQVSRLNEALLLSYGAMYNSETGTNFNAVDRVVKIVRELDRYHGFSLPQASPQAPRAEAVPRLPPPAQEPIACCADRRAVRKWHRKRLKRLDSDAEMAPAAEPVSGPVRRR